MKSADKQAILFAFGVNHKTAPIEVREKVYVHGSEMPALLARLRETLEECVIVSTCNRTEIYGIHPSSVELDFDYYKNLLIEFKGADKTVKKEDFFSFVSCAACEQLFSVATSIDSKIVGDTQILQQLRQAYQSAKDAGFTGKIINQLFQRAFKVGKKTYLETFIHKGAISISLAAVELARHAFGSLADKTVLIIGAGETAHLTAECLLKKRIGKIFVTNRTRSHAEEFLANLHKSHHFNGEVIDFANFRERLNETDIVISSTSSPDYILHAEDFATQKRKILLIDIAMPRDIAPEVGENQSVILKNIDDLNLVVDQNYEKRMTELPRVKKIIYHEMADFLIWYYSLPLLPAACRAGARLDIEGVNEIKRIKEFLASNASLFHKMAQQRDAKSELKEHLNLVNHLWALKSSPAPAVIEGAVSFEA